MMKKKKKRERETKQGVPPNQAKAATKVFFFKDIIGIQYLLSQD